MDIWDRLLDSPLPIAEPPPFKSGKEKENSMKRARKALVKWRAKKKKLKAIRRALCERPTEPATSEELAFFLSELSKVRTGLTNMEYENFCSAVVDTDYCMIHALSLTY